MMKFTAQLAKDLAVALEKVAPMFAEIKAAGDDSGTFRVIATTQGKDRDGEIVLQEGLDITNFMKNPIILFGHNYWDLPIGKATKVEKNSETGQTIVEGIFASEEMNPMAQKVRRLYDAGILVATSIGFIAKEWEGNVITQSELLELSFVPVPANPDALDMIKELHLESELKEALSIATKGGYKLEGAYAKFYEDMKTTEAKEEKEISLASISEKLDNTLAEMKSVKELLVGVHTKLTSKEAEAPKAETTEAPEGAAPTDEEVKAFLGDVHKQAQIVARVVNDINAALKSKIAK